jgi:hypothetical protein
MGGEPFTFLPAHRLTTIDSAIAAGKAAQDGVHVTGDPAAFFFTADKYVARYRAASSQSSDAQWLRDAAALW